MHFVLLLAVLVSFAATVVAFLLCRKIRDWRLTALTVLILVLAFQQTYVLLADRTLPGTVERASSSWPQAWTDLVTSTMALLMVMVLSSILREREHTEHDVRSNSELLSQILRHIPHSVFWKDRNFRFLGCNDNLARLLGFDRPEDLIGKSDFELPSIDPEHAKNYREADKEVIRAGHSFINLEEKISQADGTLMDAVTSKVPLRDEKGTAIGVLGIFFDITERKRAEQALRESQHLYHSLVESLPQCIFRRDRAGHFTFVNQRYCDLHLKAYDQIVGHTIYELYPADISKRILDSDLRVFETGETFHTVQWLPTRSGKAIRVQVIKTPVRDEQDRTVEIQGVFWDITEQHESEEKLRERDETLAHVTRLTTMGEMVAGIAHEINQPLYAIANFATASSRILESDEDNTQNRLLEWNREISQQANRAGDILRRLAAFTKKSPVQNVLIDLNHLIRESLELVGLDARRHRVKHQLKLANDLPRVQADAIQIQQVLVNLLRNAYEATAHLSSPPHEVSVRSHVVQNNVQISVSDNGPGLPDQDADKLFETFYTTKPDGMGMGLSIARTIVESHGGKIWAQPNPDHGATFSFSLPIDSGDRRLGN